MTIKSFLAVFFGFLLSMPQLIPSIEFYTQSLRSGIFQKSEVIPWGYIPTLIAPDFFGNPVTRNDWFGHYAEWNAYFGFIPLVLSFFSFKKFNNPHIRFFFVFGIISLLLALPTPLNDFLISIHIPVLSTSSMSRIIVLFSFSFAILAGFGFDTLVESVVLKKTKLLVWVFLFFSTVFTLLWIIILVKLLIPHDKIIISRQNLILPSILFFLFVLLVFLSFFMKKKAYKFLSIIVILFVTFDLVRFSSKWMSQDPINLMFVSTPLSQYLDKLPKGERVMGNLEAGICTYYQISCLGGYDPLYIDRYGSFVYSISGKSLRHGERSVVSFPKSGDNEISAINLLNVTYVVHKTSDDFVPWTFPYWQYGSKFVKTFDDGKYKVFKNLYAYPRAFLANNYKVITNDQNLINKMFDKNTDLKNTIFLEEDPNLSLDYKVGSAKVLTYRPNYIKIKTESIGKSLLFLSDPYYPGWQAFVDGKEEKILRADFAFRAIVVPEGHHEIIFSYFPNNFKLSLIISVVGIIGLSSSSFFLRKRG